MDREVERHFAQVEILRREVSEETAVLRLRARWVDKQIAVTEIIEAHTRWYSYYLFQEARLLIGLDNAPDRPALRLKYGKEFTQHLYERIPHLHTRNKEKLELTDEKTFDDFVKMVLEFKE